MASAVDICNRALTLIKCDRITSLEDGSESARQCSAIYEFARDSALRAHPWNFAIVRKELAKLSSDPEWGYSSQFALPTDCLRILSIEGEVEYSVEGRMILSDSDTISIQYVKRETDANQYDAMFIEALVYKIASMLAFPMTASVNGAEVFDSLYEKRVAEARGVDAREGSTQYITASGWLNARRGRSLA